MNDRFFTQQQQPRQVDENQIKNMLQKQKTGHLVLQPKGKKEFKKTNPFQMREMVKSQMLIKKFRLICDKAGVYPRRAKNIVDYDFFENKQTIRRNDSLQSIRENFPRSRSVDCEQFGSTCNKFIKANIYPFMPKHNKLVYKKLKQKMQMKMITHIQDKEQTFFMNKVFNQFQMAKKRNDFIDQFQPVKKFEAKKKKIELTQEQIDAIQRQKFIERQQKTSQILFQNLHGKCYRQYSMNIILGVISKKEKQNLSKEKLKQDRSLNLEEIKNKLSHLQNEQDYSAYKINFPPKINIVQEQVHKDNQSFKFQNKVYIQYQFKNKKLDLPAPQKLMESYKIYNFSAINDQSKNNSLKFRKTSEDILQMKRCITSKSKNKIIQEVYRSRDQLQPKQDFYKQNQPYFEQLDNILADKQKILSQ